MTARPRFVVQLLIAALAVGSASCTSSPGGDADDSGGQAAPATIEQAGSTGDASATDGLAALPVRDGPRRETTLSVPHVQLDAVIVAEVDDEVLRRAFSLPGMVDRESGASLPGARSLWLADDIELARPEIILSGREFGHIHPDGSLHILLPVERAVEVAETKWGELHPWVGRDDFWDGYVMLYTPETIEEVDVTTQLIVEAYNFVTGADIDPETLMADGGSESDDGSESDGSSESEDGAATATPEEMAAAEESRRLAEAATDGDFPTDDRRLLAVEAATRSPTPESTAALGLLVFTDDRSESSIVRVEHDGPVRVVGVAADGDAVITGSGDATAKVWSTGGDLLTTLAHPDEVRAVQLSADGQRIATGAADGTAAAWNAVGEQLASVQHDDQVNAVAISPDGAIAVSGGRDGAAFVFDVESGDVRHEFEHPDMVWSVDLSPDGEQVATGGADGRGGQVRVWDLTTGAELLVHEVGQPVDILSFSPDGQWLFAGGRGGAAVLIDAASGEALPALEAGFRGGIVDVDWHPDGGEVAVTSLGGTHRFELPTGALTDESQVAGGSRGVSYGPDGSWYVTGSGDFQFSFGEIAFWDTETGMKLTSLNLGGPVESISVHGNGTVFAGYRTTEDLVEIGGAWLVPGPDDWLALACAGTDGVISEATWSALTDEQGDRRTTCP